MTDVQCKTLFDSYLYVPQQDIDRYDWMRVLRLSIIFFSAVLLLVNIVLIIKRKQYKFNTIKLFMFVEIFYVISLLSVTPHGPDFNLGFCEFGQYRGDPPLDKQDFYNCIIQTGEEYWAAIEGYVNMLCYAISYWFAVCITLYIKHVLENTHKQFMRKRGPLIFSVCFLISLWFLVPFALTFLEDVPFSFGPAGYQFYSVSQYFFYSGVINRDGSILGSILAIVWMLLLPLSLFGYHIYLLCSNQDYISRLIKLDELNARQFFIIKSGRLSFIIFFVQIFNVSKLIFALVLQSQSDQNPIAQIILFSLNTIFDLMPIILIWMYFRHYYGQGRALQEKSDLMDKSLVSSFTSAHII